MRNKKGFTLIEMLVVIAIIAILVAIIIPIVSTATKKAKASTDAANLREALGELNVHTVDGTMDPMDIVNLVDAAECKTDSDAQMYAVYEGAGFIAVYYRNGSKYYSLDYLSDVATNGESSLSTAKPTHPGAEWYLVG